MAAAATLEVAVRGLACGIARVDQVYKLGSLRPLELLLQPVQVRVQGVRIAGAQQSRLPAPHHLNLHWECCAVNLVRRMHRQAGTDLRSMS